MSTCAKYVSNLWRSAHAVNRVANVLTDLDLGLSSRPHQTDSCAIQQDLEDQEQFLCLNARYSSGPSHQDFQICLHPVAIWQLHCAVSDSASIWEIDAEACVGSP